MRRILLAAVTAVGIIAGEGVVWTQIANSEVKAQPTAETPNRIDNFRLTDQSLMSHELYYFKYAPAIVIMSRSNGSNFSAAASAELEKLDAVYKAKGVIFYTLDSNLKDARDAVAAEIKAQKLNIPVLMDEQQLVGEQLHLLKEGEVYVINPKTWSVAYRGPVDARFSSAKPNLNSKASQSFVADAIDAVLAGATVPATTAPVGGAVISFPARDKAAGFAKISYANEVAPIIQEKCVSCHIAGGIAPFSMDGYERVKGFSPMIRESLRTQRMPPYFADPHIGQFKNDQGLTSDQRKLLVHWIEAGSPRGEGSDPLAANKGKHAPEWPLELGKPDLIVDLPAYDVPASGVIEYQNQRVDNPFKQDTWLKAIAIKPGDRRVVHHVTSSYIPDLTQGKPDIPAGSVGSYTPGANPQIMAEGSGAPVPGGGKLNFQMHYTAFGSPTTDRTQIGFYTLKTPPEYVKRQMIISNVGVFIPAGESRHKEVAYVTLPADAYLYLLSPHAHYRGYHVEMKQIDPDGKETMVLALPRYDFNWQREYEFTQPRLVRAGTKLVVTWIYDNSSHNPANPDATRDVTWGEQTPDEMMYFRVNYRWADETTSKLRNDLTAKLSTATLIGGLDTNMDGKLQPDELRGSLTRLRDNFAELDKDHDGALSESEVSGISRSVSQAAARGQ